MAGTLLVLLPLHYGWRLAGRDSPWPRRFLGIVGRIAGAKVRVVGAPLRRDVLFLANHLSWLDIVLLAGATGASFVSKDEVESWPLVGWLARINRTIFIARAQRGTVRGQADALRNALASGRPVALFPEGTTDAGVEVLPFRASLLASLFPPLPHLRVQPVAIDYGTAAREIAWVGDEPALDNAKRLLGRAGHFEIALHFLAPIDPAEAADRKALAEAARTEVVTALGASDSAGNGL